MKICIIVRFDLTGVHYWPNAPDRYNLLRMRHSHIFHFDISIPVEGSRQLEFLEVRRQLERVVKDEYGDVGCDFGALSCEDLAEWMMKKVEELYGVHPSRAVVMEDAFVGAEVIE